MKDDGQMAGTGGRRLFLRFQATPCSCPWRGLEGIYSAIDFTDWQVLLRLSDSVLHIFESPYSTHARNSFCVENPLISARSLTNLCQRVRTLGFAYFISTRDLASKLFFEASKYRGLPSTVRKGYQTVQFTTR